MISFAEIGPFLKSQVLEKPKRTAWILLGLSLFYSARGFHKGYEILVKFSDIFGDNEVGGMPTYRQVIEAAKSAGVDGAYLAFEFLLFIGISWAIVTLIEKHVVRQFVFGGDPSAAEKNILLDAVFECGIAKVFLPRTNCQISAQSYAESVKLSVKGASDIRLLTIACYEYLGRRDESLLFNILKANRHKPTVEVVCLDHQGGHSVVKDRVALLSSRDSKYSEATLKSHIEQTVAAIRDLKDEGVAITAWKTVIHPGFRLLIADDVMFVSAYSRNKHGHESHMFQIDKNSDATWFSAFEAYYDQVRTGATQLI